jgi:glycosyl hydrolase family 106( putative alpha-L-rhamnosidase)
MFLLNTAFTSGALTLRRLACGEQAVANSAVSSSEPEGNHAHSALLRQQFQTPPKKYRPLVRWWWPGDDVTEPELRREIGVLDEAGFGGAEIQAFLKGLDMKEFSDAQLKQVNGFASPSFFRHVAAAADEARKRGMFIDYTFGSGWPFGGSEAIAPELASVELRSTHLSVEGPAKLRRQLQIPTITGGDPSDEPEAFRGLPDGWAERFKKRTKLVAVVAVRGADAQWDFHHEGGPRQTVTKPGQLEPDTSIDLTSQLSSGGILTWDVPPGTWQIFVFCSVPTRQRVNGASGEGPQFVMDHLSVEAFRAHAQRVGNNAIPYLGEYFGNGLRAIFCDSLEVAANLFWSDDFLSEFRRHRGYDLLPYLPILRVQSYAEPYGEYVDLPVFDMDGIGDQVRNDYRQTLSDIMAERFYGEFNKWAHEHKLLSRTQAHGAPGDVLRIYGESDIPETEDLYDRGGYDFLKMAASAAHVYGRAIVGSESFVWPTAAYQTTPEKMKLAADELFTAGVNAIVYHGFPYIIPDIPSPGWHPFSGINGSGNYSSQFNELNPFWPYFAKINSYITRVQFFSQSAKTVAAVALYRNDLAHGAEEMPPAPRLNQALMDAGYNYDHINAESLLHSAVRDNKLMTAGGSSYRALVLPPTEAISAGLADQLNEFARAGLPLLFARQTPMHADGIMHSAKQTERVQAAMRSIRSELSVYVANDIDDLLSALAKTTSPNVRFHSAPLPFIQKRIGKMNAFFVRNPSDSGQNLRAEFEAEGVPELWDAWTGQTANLAKYRRNGTWIEVNYQLQPFASALIVFDASASPHPVNVVPVAQRLNRTEEIGAAGWTLVVTGLDPSGKTAVIHRNLASLVDWSLDHELRGISGRGVYSTAFTVSPTDAGKSFLLDLGSVKDVAEVIVNGKPAGSLLLRPFQIDLTSLLRSGENTLEITVTNGLFNRMVLREPRPFRAGPTESPSGLMSGGLIGPVGLRLME